MKNEFKYEFIASSKVIRFKICHKAADILATLMSKKKYFEESGKEYSYKGKKCFYVSHYDIMEETCFTLDVVKSRLKLLKNSGLIDYAQQGLNKPNVYFLNEENIIKYINIHKADYIKWRISIRDKKNKAICPMVIKEGEKQLSGTGESHDQEVPKTAATNNKITNNKTTNNFTNHINVAENIKYWSQMTEKLEDIIGDVNPDDEDDRLISVESICNFLLQTIPNFKTFIISNLDREMVDKLFDSSVYPYIIANKIISNAKRIAAGQLKSRFGNFFVGLDEINKGIEEKYHR